VVADGTGSPSDASAYDWVLRRSRARRAVLEYLATCGPSYAAAIARATGLNDVACVGALRGLGKRYAPERSLLALGLVRASAGQAGGPRRYDITPLGARVAARERAMKP